MYASDATRPHCAALSREGGYSTIGDGDGISLRDERKRREELTALTVDLFEPSASSGMDGMTWEGLNDDISVLRTKIPTDQHPGQSRPE